MTSRVEMSRSLFVAFWRKIQPRDFSMRFKVSPGYRNVHMKGRSIHSLFLRSINSILSSTTFILLLKVLANLQNYNNLRRPTPPSSQYSPTHYSCFLCTLLNPFTVLAVPNPSPTPATCTENLLVVRTQPPELVNIQSRDDPDIYSGPAIEPLTQQTPSIPTPVSVQGGGHDTSRSLFSLPRFNSGPAPQVNAQVVTGQPSQVAGYVP